MADALCGPSNALQQFQKHTTVDRTLQQDRLQSRQSPLQGFRSHPGPNAGVLDAEFEAFQAGFVPGPSLEFDQVQSFGPSNAISPFSQTPQAAPDWAADFQRLHVSNMSAPIPQQHFRAQAPLQRSAPGGWHQDFMRQNTQASSQRNVYSEPGASQSYTGMSLNNGYGMTGPSMYGGTGMAIPDEASQQAPSFQQSEPTFDEAALERAFEEAAASEVQDQHQDEVVQNDLLETTRPYDESLEALPEQMMQEYLEDLERIGADTIEDTRELDKDRSNADEGDELARTAGALLDRVKDDQSEKFQQSSFLALMRQLRDKEIVVEGNDMVQEPQRQSPSHPLSGPDQPHMDTTMTGAINADDIVRESIAA